MRIDNALRGRRIVIRNYEKSDLDFVAGMWLNEENGKYMSDPTADHVDAVFQNALETLQDSRFGYYLIIELTGAGERVGSFSVFPDEAKKVYDIGYCIHKNHWRQGFATEAHGAEKVTAEVAVQNTASNALLGKFGFEIERQTEFQKYNMDVQFDSYIYAKRL